jgi:hypothetical protein
MTQPLPTPVGQDPPPLRQSPSPNRTNGRPPALHKRHGGKAKRKPTRRRTADRFAVLNAFVDFALGGLTRNEIAVWLVLYRDTKPDGTARRSQADLARRAGTSDRTVRRALKRLETAGLLKVVYRGGFRRGQSRYRVRPLRTNGA